MDRSESVPPLVTESDEREAAGASSWTERIARRETLSGGVSTVVHLVVLLFLAVLLIPAARRPDRNTLISGPATDPQDVIDPEMFEVEPDETAVILATDTLLHTGVSEAPSLAAETLIGGGALPALPTHPNPRSLFQSKDAPVAGWHSLRTPEARGRLTAEKGPGSPSAASESAVERGLAWLAAHQTSTGGWRFDHNHESGPCQGRCRNAGNASATTGATGLALLAFLGAGYTHREGPYQRVVREGLYYLQGRGLITDHGADLREGDMYGQGIATLALCEAYAMTRDRGLRSYAQQAVDFIIYAQSPTDGGWRYNPHQPGDTTVTAWQLMALRSAQSAGLHVEPQVIYRAEHFFDTVQFDDGAQFGYNEPKPRPKNAQGRARHACTAIGLLCRMYAGWSRRDAAIERGIGLLDQWGPAPNDLYYNYYGSLTLHHYGGSVWKRWDETMQAQLIATQSIRGHENGSWYFPDHYGDSGGRHYNTCMAIMILEVYYRYLPLYRDGR